MDIGNGGPEPLLVRNQPMTDVPVFPGMIVFSVMAKPELRHMLVIIHEQDAVFLSSVQDKVHVVVHQTETDDLDRVVDSEPDQAERDAVDPGDKLSGGTE